MKSIIIGTAGHIDHGKTALVRALTGIDTDRLEEEKRRGITIDLGFAHLELKAPSGEKLRFGFIDVPGHERFVRNMLAGVGGIDLVLLVIAADESIKPQTREHFEICRLLSISRGITVSPKSDLVDEDTLNVVRLEAEEFLRGSFLDASRSPMVAVSVRTGAGLEELKQEIARLSVEAPARDTEALFRLPIDRVFAMKGFGTVTTGTLIAGKVQKEDEVEVFPSGRRVRIRGVQVHGATAERASAGQRTALNLAGLSVEELARGMTLAVPGALQTTQQVDVRLSLLKDAKPLKNRARVHLHAFTSETIAEVVLHERNELKPGASGLARLRTDDPVLVLPGDRAILRQFSPVVTVGGSVVLDGFPLRRQKKDALLSFLNAVSNGPQQEALLARIQRRGQDGLSFVDAVRETGVKKTTLQPVVTTLLQQKQIIQAGELLIAAGAVSRAREQTIAALDTFHKAKSPKIDVAKFKDLTGVSRKYAIPLLEYLDRERVTRRVGDERIIL